MSKTNVTRKCGCHETLVLDGNAARRANRAKWESEKNCFKCQIKINNETAKQNQLELGLPQLTGTEKQISYAENLRDKCAKQLINYRDRLISGEIPGQEQNKNHVQYVNKIIAVTDSKFWIDNSSRLTTSIGNENLHFKYLKFDLIISL